MTKIAANLHELGWIVRIADESDARAWQIDIAPEGLAALLDWRHRLGDALVEYFQDLDDQEVAAIRTTIDVLTDRIQRMDPHSAREQYKKNAEAKLADPASS